MSEFMNRKQVADLFGMSVASVRRLEKSGALPVVKIGPHSLRFRRSDIESFVTAHSVKGKACTSGI
jgi:excisionase family DNA binding protein